MLPNAPQTAALFLAVASLGAVWSVCAPDMGPVAVLDRFRQIEPVVLLACDRVRWGGMEHDKRGLVDELLAGLPSVRHSLRGAQRDALLAGAGGEPPALEPGWLPFDHPLWIVYSSGTTVRAARARPLHPPRPTGARCGALLAWRARPSSARARPSTRAA